MEFREDPERMVETFQSQGAAGVVAFMGLLILQVFAAVVPGGPFEIAAGLAFGPVRGALICDAAITVGSTLVFLFSRKFGMKFIELFFSREKIEGVKILRTTEQSEVLIFLLFLIPGTPKDLLSYLVGLTDLPLLHWILIAAVGRFPAILLSTMSGSAIAGRRYEIFILLMAVLAALSVLGTVWYRRKNKDGGEKGDRLTKHSC